MRLCYQVATPEVICAESVTAYQGPLEKSFEDLGNLGYDAVELMTLNPSKLNWDFVRKEAEKNKLAISLVCTGEIFGQLGLSYTNPKEEIRKEAIRRTKEIIDFASYLDANINIGRVRGQYCKELSKEITYQYAVEAFKEISCYSEDKNVKIALETVTIMQTNFINTLEEGMELVEAVNHPNFKLMMDVFHLNLEEKDLFESIKRYCNQTIHVHLADNNRRYPGHCGMDFDKVIKTFFECGYDNDFSVEVFQIPNQELAARGAITHLKPMFTEYYGIRR